MRVKAVIDKGQAVVAIYNDLTLIYDGLGYDDLILIYEGFDPVDLAICCSDVSFYEYPLVLSPLYSQWITNECSYSYRILEDSIISTGNSTATIPLPGRYGISRMKLKIFMT
jgi:hypothetical protein